MFYQISLVIHEVNTDNRIQSEAVGKQRLQARTHKVRAFRGMKKFLKFTIIWISQNLATPFWIVGHIHLSVNVYEDIYEILSSVGLNIIVAIGFYMDYKLNTNTNR